jgi:hypothetical protein
MTAHYLVPGAPTPPPPAPQANSYRPPSGSLQQAAQPSPQPSPQASDQETHHRALLAEWRAHHADAWVKADELNPAVRRVIDPKDRTAAIRQKLRQLASTQADGLRLEARAGGNRPDRAACYRVVEIASP